jgi:LacI family transcriptional regulator
MSVTIKDVARYCKLSKSTVSRVVNKSGPVSPKSREKVLAAVKVMNFQPHAVARSLALKRSDSFSMIVQDIRNPYYGHAIWHAERLFRERGFSLDIYNTDNNKQLERIALENVFYRRVDGLLSIGGDRDATSIIQFHSAQKVPTVLIDREVQGYDIPMVNLDNFYGARLAANHLFDLGHTRIVFVSSDFTLAERRRRDGFTDACRERGMTTEEISIISPGEERWSEAVSPDLAKLFAGRQAPTAIFASNDVKALHVIRILKQLGMSVPEDVSVIGFDDIDMSSIVLPSLTTIHQPLEELMQIAVGLLMDSVEGRQADSVRQVPKPWLVPRESTSAPRKVT